MSIKINWESLEAEDLSSWTRDLLTSALNSGERPTILDSDTSIKDLSFGKEAPNFEILEIGELERDRFRGIFKVSYLGDFSLTLHTKVQANPLNIHHSNSMAREVGPRPFITPHFALSSENFALPLDLKLSDLKINGIGIIVFSRSKGLTLVFKNDPLDSIAVSSTFDTVQVLATFLQNQIEKQIRDLFRETLPTLIHQVSVKFLSIEATTAAASTISLTLPLLMSELTDASENNMDFFGNYSAQSLLKTVSLFNSRETMLLNVPKLSSNIVQRSHLDKFNKNSPSLLNALRKSLKSDDTTTTDSLVEVAVLAASSSPSKISARTNTIPASLLCNENHDTTCAIIKKISTVQTHNYYKESIHERGSKNQSLNGLTVKPKRRIIRLGKGKLQAEPSTANKSNINGNTSTTSVNCDAVSLPPTPVSSPVDSGDPTRPVAPRPQSINRPSVTKSLAHPRPVLLSHEVYHELLRSYQDSSSNLPHPLLINHSTSSVLTGVGLGSYHNHHNHLGFNNYSNSPRAPSPTRITPFARHQTYSELASRVYQSSSLRSGVAGEESGALTDSGLALSESCKRVLDEHTHVLAPPPPYYTP